MFEILVYTRSGDKQIAKLKTPIIPRIGEFIDIDATHSAGIFRTRGEIADVEYRFDKDENLKCILIFLDIY